MKNKLLFFALLYTLLSFGQQKQDIVLKWTDNVVSYLEDKQITLPEFDAKYMSYDQKSGQIFFSTSFSVTANVNPASLQVTNVVYESISREILGSLLEKALPTALNEHLYTSTSRDRFFAHLKLSPIIKDGSGYKRVKSFSFTYAFGGQTSARAGASAMSVTNSALASGEWYRFYVEKSGVYKINRNFLQQLGFNTNTDPRNIKIYGNGGRMLPLLNSTPYPMDLAENAIEFIGEQDGTFDSGDYILFYAEGVDNWNQENGTHNNLYADKSYYYVTSAGGQGKRIGAMQQPTGVAGITTGVFDEYQFHEQDLVNIAKLGRKWHGEQFNVNNEQEFKFEIPDIDLSNPVAIKVSAAANSLSATSMAVEANGSALGTISFVTPDTHSGAGDGSLSQTFTPSNGTVTLKLTYNNNGVPSSNAWLDYITVQAKRKLQGNGKQFRFRYNAAANNTGVIQYNVGNATGVSEVWDITDIYNAGKIVNTGNQSQFSFKSWLGEVRQYVAVVPTDYYLPKKESKPKVANQNLKGTIFNDSQGTFQDIDYIIVTPDFLKAQADKLANIHRNQSGLNVKVVTLENLYQEFSSGKQDIGAIRNFIKYVYYNASSTSKRVRYVNLFGDASFDYKDRITGNTNIVPILNFYDPSVTNDPKGTSNYSSVNTFVSDEFYVMMDPEEGAVTKDAELMDIAVGRMLVSSTSQAEEMVNKVVQYKTAESYGRWRNEYIALADDKDLSSDDFVPPLMEVDGSLGANRPFVNVRKIFADSYVQEASAGGQRYPQAKEDFIRAINYGALVVNYLGHGGETGMASERLFERSDAQSLNNKDKYPLFITVTCELTKFDNPLNETTGEFIYWNAAGGAIAMVTTTRAIFISTAKEFIKDFTGRLYAYGFDEYPSMAEALMQSKVESTIDKTNLRCISFVGDPALSLAIPKAKIVLTAINDIPVAQSTETLQSLGYVKLSGQVTNESGAVINGYTGELEVTVFDKQIDRTTLANDGNGPKIPFKTLGETIFRGNASVTNGKFEFGFVVPRDIKVPVGNGRVSFYSKRTGILEDHTGYDNVIKVGGVNANAEEDKIAPTVKLYMNDESFVSGGITNASPILLANLEDEHGINTASGIGHDIVGILDGDETNQFLMNDYYETELNNYKKGTLRFPFNDLEKGLHTLTFKAWDVYNNLVTAEIQFVVVGDDELKLEKVLNYPNPFVSYTEFWFNHNRPYEPLDVQVQIFTVTGKVVKTINQSVTTDGFLCRDIKWDGRDDFGDKIGKGVYIYKLTVRSTVTHKTAEKYEKLVLL